MCRLVKPEKTRSQSQCHAVFLGLANHTLYHTPHPPESPGLVFHLGPNLCLLCLVQFSLVPLVPTAVVVPIHVLFGIYWGLGFLTLGERLGKGKIATSGRPDRDRKRDWERERAWGRERTREKRKRTRKRDPQSETDNQGEISGRCYLWCLIGLSTVIQVIYYNLFLLVAFTLRERETRVIPGGFVLSKNKCLWYCARIQCHVISHQIQGNKAFTGVFSRLSKPNRGRG